MISLNPSALVFTSVTSLSGFDEVADSVDRKERDHQPNDEDHRDVEDVGDAGQRVFVDPPRRVPEGEEIESCCPPGLLALCQLAGKTLGEETLLTNRFVDPPVAHRLNDVRHGPGRQTNDGGRKRHHHLPGHRLEVAGRQRRQRSSHRNQRTQEP